VLSKRAARSGAECFSQVLRTAPLFFVVVFVLMSSRGVTRMLPCGTSHVITRAFLQHRQAAIRPPFGGVVGDDPRLMRFKRQRSMPGYIDTCLPRYAPKARRDTLWATLKPRVPRWPNGCMLKSLFPGP